ncbi:GGDEF domain-containing protein [Phytohabitans kaempferiae]|uniref:GGDEF domain-containing protein n=1 Tax=Phytohabitans kaempferiae TaxID=1620943 RepID=A0ABV6MBK7_9ACTN
MIMALRKENARLEAERDTWREAAHHDMLTGVLNRRGLYSSAPSALAAADALAVVDVDAFKHINDEFGHDVGDVVLVAVARHLAETSTGGLVARLGGDEFAVVLTAPGRRATAAWLQHITGSLATSINVAGLTVTLSVGIAPVAGELSIFELLRRADSAMYRAKAGHTAEGSAIRSTGTHAYDTTVPGGQGVQGWLTRRYGARVDAEPHDRHSPASFLAAVCRFHPQR